MSDDSLYKVKVTIGDATIEIEGAQQGVPEIVRALKDLFAQRTPGTQTDPHRDTPRQNGHDAPQVRDIRTFFAEKNPANDIEATAAAAYYFQHVAPPEEKAETLNAERLERAFELAKRPKPRAIAQTIRNAKNAGYLDTTSQPGEFRLNPVGYNLVVHTLGATESARTPKAQKHRKRTATQRRKPRSSSKKHPQKLAKRAR